MTTNPKLIGTNVSSNDFLDAMREETRVGVHEYDQGGLVEAAPSCQCGECRAARQRHDVPCTCQSCSKRRADQNARWAAGTEPEDD